MSKTRKWHVRAIHLAVALAMTLGLLMVPAAVAAPPDSEAAASPGIIRDAPLHFGAGPGGDVMWSLEKTHPMAMADDCSIYLKGPSVAAYAMFHLFPTEPMTIQDLSTFKFWVYSAADVADYSMTIEFEVDVNGDGHRTYPPDYGIKSSAMSFGPLTTGWHELTALDLPGTDTGWFYVDHNDTSSTQLFSAWKTALATGVPIGGVTDFPTKPDGTTVDGTENFLRIQLGGAVTTWGSEETWVDDVTVNDTTYDLEAFLIPSLGVDVKGSEQTFTINGYINVGPIFADVDTDIDSVNSAESVDTVVDNSWTVTPGVNSPVVTVEAGGDLNAPYITVSAIKPGDCLVKVKLDDEDDDSLPDMTLDAEKKWGKIYHTELVAEKTTVAEVGEEIDIDETVIATIHWGSMDPEDERYLAAGGADVNWWLLEDTDDNQDELYDILVDIFGAANVDIAADGLSGEACGKYAEEDDPFTLLDAWYVTGADLVTAVAGVNKTYFSKTEGDSTSPAKPTYVKTVTDDSLPPALCRDVERGWTQASVTFENIATAPAEDTDDVIVITLATYPVDLHGQNPVCVEFQKITPRIVPPAEVKTTQVRWAGEKIILEKDWSDEIICGHYYVAIYHMDEASVGTLYIGGDNDASELAGGDIWVWVDTTNPTSEVILESQLQGEADVEVALYEYGELKGMNVEALFDSDEPLDSATAQIVIDWMAPLVNTGFMVYYLAFEDVTLAEDITPAASLTKALPGLCMDVDVAVQVRGWFTSDALPGTDREAVDLDGDGVYELPAGRYVLPDDWAAMAGNNYELRPNWDLMDQADNDTINSIAELGPYDTAVKTTTPPGEAVLPSIGPFSTLQQWTAFEMWDAGAFAPTSHPLYPLGRNTVVPDGSLDDYDCPMPQALVIFDVVAQVVIPPDTGTLSGLDKGDLEGYGYAVDVSGTATGGTTTTLVDTAQAWTAGLLIGRTVVIVKDCTTYERIITANTATSLTWVGALPSAVAAGDTYYLKVYQSPFYEVEIPSSSFIPSAGYNWASWGVDLGPYDYWTDLHILSINADTTEDPVDPTLQDIQDVEVYCDNHGIAGVTIDAPIQTGTVTITATAEFPNSLKKGKYGPRTSDEITATWGPIELNPHFTADKTDVDVDETLTFDNLTTGGTHPYTRAEWDFNNDGIIDLTLTGTEAAVMASVGTAYAADGVYGVTLHMTDSTPTTRYETRDDYITVGTGGVPPVTWNLAYGLDVDPAAVNIWLYPASAATVTLLDVDATMPDGLLIWYYSLADGWTFYKKGWGVSNTLTTLVPGGGIFGIVPTASEWEIPQA